MPLHRQTLAPVFLLLVLVLTGGGIASGQDATPGTAGTGPGQETTLRLFDITLPADVRPEDPVEVTWYRGNWEPGARMTVPTDSPVEGITTDFSWRTAAPGINLTYVAWGEFQIRSGGAIHVARTLADGTTGRLEPVAAETPIDVRRGDVVVFGTDASFHGRNIGQDRVTLISVLMLAADSPAGSGPTSFSLDGAVDYEPLAGVAAEEWDAVGDGALSLALTRTLLPPGAVLGPYDVPDGSLELLAVEAGVMDIGLDYDGNGEPETWMTLQYFIPVNEMLRGESRRAIRASTEPEFPQIGEVVDEEDPAEPGPLVFMSLTFIAAEP